DVVRIERLRVWQGQDRSARVKNEQFSTGHAFYEVCKFKTRNPRVLDIFFIQVSPHRCSCKYRSPSLSTVRIDRAMATEVKDEQVVSEIVGACLFCSLGNEIPNGI